MAGWALFAGASFLLALTPGPDIAYVAAQGAARGPRAGVVAALGLCTGILFHTAAVALGLAEVLARLPAIFAAIQLIGALYILRIAWLLWREASASREAREGAPPRAATLGAIYRQTIIMNLLNPKVALFFLAFLPQFVDAQAGSPRAQFIALGAIFLVVSLAVMATAGVLAGWAGRSAGSSPRKALWLGRGAALAVAAIALWTLVSGARAALAGLG